MRQWLVCEINVISKIWQHNSAKINISGGECNITISQYPISHEMHVVQQYLVESGQRWIFLRKINISSRTPKMALHENPGTPWSQVSNISARTSIKAIFLHIVVIFLHGLPQKVFCAQLKKDLAKSAMYNIILLSLPWYKGPFKSSFSIDCVTRNCSWPIFLHKTP